MDLRLDKAAFTQASRELNTKCNEIRDLRGNIERSMEQLRRDWDSPAGRQFFAKFERDLMNNLRDYSTIFEHMSRNLMTASNRYEEVFRAADAVASTQY